jgi:hypothetical protein
MRIGARVLRSYYRLEFQLDSLRAETLALAVLPVSVRLRIGCPDPNAKSAWNAELEGLQSFTKKGKVENASHLMQIRVI